jgi:hypothetical protein
MNIKKTAIRIKRPPSVNFTGRLLIARSLLRGKIIHQSPGGNNSFGIISGNFECKEDDISVRADIDLPIDNASSENSSEERLFFM